jgi:hypothetical protein
MTSEVLIQLNNMNHGQYLELESYIIRNSSILDINKISLCNVECTDFKNITNYQRLMYAVKNPSTDREILDELIIQYLKA